MRVTAPTGPAGNSLLVRLIAERPITAFILMSYTISFSTELTPALTENTTLYGWTIWDVLMSFTSSALPAFVVVAACGSWQGIRDLAGRALRWRVAPRWYFVAILALPLLTILLASTFSGLEPIDNLIDKWDLVFTLLLPQLLLRVLLLN